MSSRLSYFQTLRREFVCPLLLIWTVISPAGWTAAVLEDCSADGSAVLGQDLPRIRSSRVRMLFADPSAAASRFQPYALMSALAYGEDKNCGHKPKLTPEQRKQLEEYLNASVGNGSTWQRVPEVELAGLCEDDLGLYYQVWRREALAATEVVLAFRGTWGWKDWQYGNLRWATRFLPGEDQYERARSYSIQVINHFEALSESEMANRPVRFYSTGHSLGGGLAQTVFYQNPDKYLQVFAFDPTPVTGFTDQPKEIQMAACACRELPEGTPPGETGIYRFYESYEVLANLRIWHKLIFNPHRHIHEVRFAFDESANIVSQHSMYNLAINLVKESNRKPTSEYAMPWYTGQGSDCTEKFESLHRQSCEVLVDATDWNLCPP